MNRAAPTVGVLGIPFDANSSFRRGPARAPAAIRRAMSSEAGNSWSERGVRVWPDDAVVDHGDLKVAQRAAVRGPIDAIERGVGRALAITPRLLLLGGDHAVSYPVVRAMAQRWGRLSMLHFDAHPDMYPEYQGNRYSHASPMARILEEGLVDRLVQVGIRSPSPEQTAIGRRYGVETHPAFDLARMGRLKFASPLYVSLDIDGLDPAFAPGVSHPEPGGLTVRQVLDVIGAVRAPRVVGGDIVELNPRLDPSGITSVVAAKLAREFLARMIVDAARPRRAAGVSRRRASAAARRSRGRRRSSGSS
jgi:agmatinase